MVRIDYTITVYERRTGQRVSAKRFKGKMPECPRDAADAQPREGRPKSKAIEAWLGAHLDEP